MRIFDSETIERYGDSFIAIGVLMERVPCDD